MAANFEQVDGMLEVKLFVVAADIFAVAAELFELEVVGMVEVADLVWDVVGEVDFVAEGPDMGLRGLGA